MEHTNPYQEATRRTFSPDERERLILEMLPQVKFRAIRIYNSINRAVELSELISAGTLGLLDAVDRFDESRGVKFQTYADLRIDGAIKDSLRKLDWASRSQRQKRKLYEGAFNTLQERFRRPPTEEEMASELGMDAEQWKKFSSEVLFVQIGTFSEVDEEGEEGEIRFVPEDDEESNPYFLFERKELLEILASEIRDLSEKEGLVLSLYYTDELNMKEIGVVLGVTESRVSQLHNQAILRLKSRLRSSIPRRRRQSFRE